MFVRMFGDPGNNLGKDLGWRTLGYNLGKNLGLVNNGNSLGKNLRFETIDYNLGNNLGYGKSWLQSWVSEHWLPCWLGS